MARTLESYAPRAGRTRRWKLALGVMVAIGLTLSFFLPELARATHVDITVDGVLDDLKAETEANLGVANGGLHWLLENDEERIGEIGTPSCPIYPNGYDIANYYFLLDFKDDQGDAARPLTLYAGWEAVGIIGDVDGDDNADTYNPINVACAESEQDGIGSREAYTVQLFSCDFVNSVEIAVKDGASNQDKVVLSLIGPAGLISEVDVTARAEVARSGHFLELKLNDLQAELDLLDAAGLLPEGFTVCNLQVRMSADAEDDGLGEDRSLPIKQVELPAEIVITKVPADTLVCPGTEVVWTIEAVNTGFCDFETVTVADMLPTGVTFVSSVPAVSGSDPQNPQWDFTDLGPGESVRIVLTAMTSASCSDQLQNDVSVEAVHTPPEACNSPPRALLETASAQLECDTDCGLPCYINGPAELCIGEPLTLCGPDEEANDFSYEWTSPDLTVSVSDDSCQTFDPAISGIYKLVVINNATGSRSEGCTHLFKHNKRPPCAIAGPDTVCAGSPVTLCGPVGNYSHAWTLPDGSEMSGQCITVEEALEGRYTLVVTDLATGCESLPCDLDIKVRKRPPCAIAGPETACPGDRVQICGPVGDFEYQWTKPDGSGATTRCLTLASVKTSDAGEYSLVITDGVTGCEGEPCTFTLKVTDPPACTITVTPQPRGTVPNVSRICTGASLTLCGPEGADYNYEWTLPGGGTSAERCIVIASATAADAGFYQLVVSDKVSGCESDPCSHEVKVGAAQCEITATPNRKVTVGERVELCGPEGDFDYLWTLVGGATATTRCIVIDQVQIADAGKYTLKITDRTSGCMSECNHVLEVGGNCDLVLTKTAKPDVIVPQPGRDCDDIGKPHTLTFRYTGDGCGASSHNQDPSKVDCDDLGALGNGVQVVYTGKDPGDFSVSPSGPINVGDEVTITTSRDRFHSETKVEIRSGSGQALQRLRFHTSCSQPLAIGDRFGSLELLGINDVRGGSNEVTYTYVIDNNGTAVVDVLLTDDKLGTIASGFDMAAGEQITFTKTATITATTTNTATVTAHLGSASGIECSANDEATVRVEAPPATCEDGKPRSLVFEYTGDDCNATTNDQSGRAKCSDHGTLGEPVEIVYVGGSASDFTVTPVGEVIRIGDRFTISATGRDKFESNSEFEVRQGGRVLQKLEIHTSCSKPLNVGDQFGSLILREFHLTLIRAATPIGDEVEVQLGMAAMVGFEKVMEAGATTLRMSEQPDLPFGLIAVGNEALEISSTASFAGAVTIVVSYDEALLQAPETELKLLRHDESSGLWREITTSVDQATNKITGRCSGLSQFAVASPLSALSADDPVRTDLGFGIRASYPNPTSGKTTVRYALTRGGSVRLTVHDIQGRHVATLASGAFGAGEHTAVWNGRALDGRKLSAGIYVIQLESGEGLRTSKLVLMN